MCVLSPVMPEALELTVYPCACVLTYLLLCVLQGPDLPEGRPAQPAPGGADGSALPAVIAVRGTLFCGGGGAVNWCY